MNSVQPGEKASAGGFRTLNRWRARGRAYRKPGKYERPLADLDQEAIALDSQDAMAYVNRGLVHATPGDPDRAIDDLGTALELAPCATWRAEVDGALEEVKSQ